ncbi:type II toxin-antitoxin system Phd/YefM family antitoxin [Haloechinothrix salitolerans]|uniref:Antitoxin n=1 Tax=Haloechinothrix salitolerans TaxID=926830 RepID=A0ABW2C8N0_9PSEU
MDRRWPTQDAKQRLSELLRAAREDGPQVVTKHGVDVAVVLDAAEYRRLAGLDVEVDLKQALVGEAADGASGDVAGSASGIAVSATAAEVLIDVVADRERDQPRDLDVGGAR